MKYFKYLFVIVFSVSLHSQNISDHPFFKHLMNNTEPGFRITGIQHIGNPEDFQAFNTQSDDDDDSGNAGDHEDDFAENMDIDTKFDFWLSQTLLKKFL